MMKESLISTPLLLVITPFLQFAMQVITAVAFALRQIRCLMTEFLIALCHPVNAFQALPLIPKYSSGEVEKLQKYISFGKVVSGRIWSTDGSALLGNCDGENFDYSEVNFKVLPKSLKLCFIKN